MVTIVLNQRTLALGFIGAAACGYGIYKLVEVGKEKSEAKKIERQLEKERREKEFSEWQINLVGSHNLTDEADIFTYKKAIEVLDPEYLGKADTVLKKKYKLLESALNAIYLDKNFAQSKFDEFESFVRVLNDADEKILITKIDIEYNDILEAKKLAEQRAKANAADVQRRHEERMEQKNREMIAKAITDGVKLVAGTSRTSSVNLDDAVKNYVNITRIVKGDN